MGEDFHHREVLQVAMISYDINGGAGPFEVVTPMFEGVVDGRKFFIVHVVIISASLKVWEWNVTGW